MKNLINFIMNAIDYLPLSGKWKKIIMAIMIAISGGYAGYQYYTGEKNDETQINGNESISEIIQEHSGKSTQGELLSAD